MSNPQQPELARSRKTPHQDQDAVAAVVEGQRQLDSDTARGPVPPDNQPGHHPAQDQDKPDLDAFAERLGIADSDSAEAQAVPGGLSGKGGTFARAAVAVTGILVLVGLVITLKRRRARRRG
jgi:hypothetical protein